MKPHLLAATVVFSLILLVPGGAFANQLPGDGILSILKQYASGVPLDNIQCKNPEHFVALRDNGKPICATERTLEHLGLDMTYYNPKPILKNTKLIINPTNLTGIIPQDITFDYVLKMPPDDPDAFAQRMAEFFDDEIISSSHERKEPSHHGLDKYTTKRGWIKIDKESLYGFPFTYTFFGPGRIPPAQAESVTTSLLDELGIKLDGTEYFDKGGMASNYDYKYMQTIGDFIIPTNVIITDFDPGYTFIHIGSWNYNLSEMDLFDIKQSKQNGREHILKYPELTGPNCDVFFSTIPTGIEDEKVLYILHERPVYKVFSGACSIPYMTGHSQMFDTFVDAITGEPLYVLSKWMF